MAKQRYINTKFWDDNYIISLDPEEKLLFIYLLTNPLTNIAGIYEISHKRISFDTGLPMDRVSKAINRFSNDKKVYHIDGHIVICNFIKHQDINPKISIGISLILNELPKSILSSIHSLSIPYIYPSNYTNNNTNTNSNNNTNNNTDFLNLCNRLSDWNDNQPSPLKDFKPENIVRKHGPEKIERLLKQYGSEDSGFSLFLNSLKV